MAKRKKMIRCSTYMTRKMLLIVIEQTELKIIIIKFDEFYFKYDLTI